MSEVGSTDSQFNFVGEFSLLDQDQEQLYTDATPMLLLC